MSSITTQTQLRAFLQRANCCFADKAYESTKVFAYGDFQKGFCEFAKVESLYNYINALKCSSTATQASIEFCFEAINLGDPFDSFNFDIEGFPGISDIDTWSFSEMIDAMNVALTAADAPFIVTASENCLTITGTGGEESLNGINISLDIVQGFGAPNHAEGRLTGGLTELNGCLDDGNEDVLIERIEEQCGCCSCVSFDYELTNDTL